MEITSGNLVVKISFGESCCESKDKATISLMVHAKNWVIVHTGHKKTTCDTLLHTISQASDAF